MASPALAFKSLSPQILNYNSQLCNENSLLTRARDYSTSVKFQSLGSWIGYCGRRGSHLKKRRKNCQASISCSMKFPTMDKFNDFSNFENYLDHVKGRILEFTPEPAKRFPWKKAANVALERLLITGKEALKWSLLAVFIFGSLSDIASSISKSKELLVPLGLLVGCAVSEFLKDVSHEFFNDDKQEENRTWRLLGIGCIFVLLKSVAIQLSLVGQGLVLHVANGGLMQVLWHLKSSGELGSTRTRNDATENESLG